MEGQVVKLEKQLIDFRNEAEKTMKTTQEVEDKEHNLQAKITDLQVRKSC